jgi:nucleoporin p58/p45
MPKHNEQLAQIPNDVEFCRRKMIGVENATDSDAQSISVLQGFIKTDAEHAKLSFKAIDNLKLPPQYHTPGIWSGNTTNDNRVNGSSEAQNIVDFFSTTADELSITLEKYQKQIIEIEQHLRGVEASSAQQINALVLKRNGGSSGQEDQMEQLTGALRDFELSLLGVAGKVGAAREGVQGLQLGRYSAPSNGYRNLNRNGIY